VCVFVRLRKRKKREPIVDVGSNPQYANTNAEFRVTNSMNTRVNNVVVRISF